MVVPTMSTLLEPRGFTKDVLLLHGNIPASVIHGDMSDYVNFRDFRLY